MKRFPKQIFVTCEDAGTEDEYLRVNKSMADSADYAIPKKAVGVYVLKETIAVSLVEKIERK